MVDSAQGWRRRWFYIRDSPVEGRVVDLEPFVARRPIKTKRSWSNDLSDEEMKEVEVLLDRLKAFQDACDLESLGVQVIRTFMGRRIQPLQARSRGMWEYSGPEDPTRVSPVEYSPSELEAKVKVVTKLKADEDLPGDPAVAPFSRDNPVPEVRLTSSLSLLITLSCSSLFMSSELCSLLVQGHEHLLRYPPSPEEFAADVARGLGSVVIPASTATSVEETEGAEEGAEGEAAPVEEGLIDSSSSVVKRGGDALRATPLNVAAPEEPPLKKMRAEDFLDLVSE